MTSSSRVTNRSGERATVHIQVSCVSCASTLKLALRSIACTHALPGARQLVGSSARRCSMKAMRGHSAPHIHATIVDVSLHGEEVYPLASQPHASGVSLMFAPAQGKPGFPEEFSANRCAETLPTAGTGPGRRGAAGDRGRHGHPDSPGQPGSPPRTHQARPQGGQPRPPLSCRGRGALASNGPPGHPPDGCWYRRSGRPTLPDKRDLAVTKTGENTLPAPVGKAGPSRGEEDVVSWPTGSI